MYLPPDIVVGGHIFLAVDNVDFCEDTPDGKRTFHGTAMAIYQPTTTTDASVTRLDCSALISVAALTTKRTTAATTFLMRPEYL